MSVYCKHIKHSTYSCSLCGHGGWRRETGCGAEARVSRATRRITWEARRRLPNLARGERESERVCKRLTLSFPLHLTPNRLEQQSARFTRSARRDRVPTIREAMAAPNIANPQFNNAQPYLNGSRQPPRAQFTREQIQSLVRVRRTFCVSSPSRASHSSTSVA